MTLTDRGIRVIIGLSLAAAVALGLFFPWERLPWNQYQPHPASPNGCWYDNSGSLGLECAPPEVAERFRNN